MRADTAAAEGNFGNIAGEGAVGRRIAASCWGSVLGAELDVGSFVDDRLDLGAVGSKFEALFAFKGKIRYHLTYFCSEELSSDDFVCWL